MAVVLLQMWLDGMEFRFSWDQAMVPEPTYCQHRTCCAGTPEKCSRPSRPGDGKIPNGIRTAG